MAHAVCQWSPDVPRQLTPDEHAEYLIRMSAVMAQFAAERGAGGAP